MIKTIALYLMVNESQTIVIALPFRLVSLCGVYSTTPFTLKLT